METPKPPRDLSAPTKRWFASIAATFELEPHHVRLLELAARAWDRAEQARKVLAKEGLTVADRYGQLKPHPCIGIEKDSAIRFARMTRELSLDVSPPDSRPPRHGGQTY